MVGDDQQPGLFPIELVEITFHLQPNPEAKGQSLKKYSPKGAKHQASQVKMPSEER